MVGVSQLVDRYLAAWNEPDGEPRRVIIDEVWTADGIYVDPVQRGEGRNGLDTIINGVHSRRPGVRFRRVGEIHFFDRRVCFFWESGLDGQPSLYKGVDFGVSTSGGQFESITGFYLQVPR